MCFLELQNKDRQALVSGYAVWPDVFARMFLGIKQMRSHLIMCVHC